MITKDSIETAYSFLHQKRNVYIHSSLDWQKDDIEYAIASFVDDMSQELYEAISDGRSNFLKEHKRFQEDITQAVEKLESMHEGNRIIRKASLPADAEGIMQVFSAAKAIMACTGNAKQWREGYPSLEIVQSDIEKNGSYVIEQDGMIVAYFAFLASPDPTYATIYDGDWLDDTLPYHVIHRIASYPDVHGIFDSIIDYCSVTEPNLRIDTHRDNRIMQHVIKKHGFTYCGIIHIASGDERLAYQKIV